MLGRMLRVIGLLLCTMAVAFGADVTGTWKFTVETDQGSGNPTFTLKQDAEKLIGTYTGMFGTAKLTGTVKGEAIEFRFKLEIDGQVLEVKYAGTVESPASMKGTVDFGGMGSGTWKAAKQ